MANTTQTPNMLLNVPVAGQESGPQYALDVNACFTIIDSHNHSPGFGVQITPAGFNVNVDLPFNSNNAITLRSSRYVAQSTTLSGSADLNCVYSVNGNLYWNNGSGTAVQITSGSSVNATSSGISSGNASASFVAGVLTVYSNASTTTPANIQGGSILLGNITSGSDYLTLSPPTLSSNYTITLPALPAAKSFMAIDTSGNITATVATANGITASNIANNTITAAQIANNTITATQIANNTIGPQQILVNYGASSSSGSFSTTSAGYTNVISASITTTGNPVTIQLISDSSGSPSYIQNGTGSAITYVRFVTQTSQVLGEYQFYSVGQGQWASSSCNAFSIALSAGTYTIYVQMKTSNASVQAILVNAVLIVREI